MGHKHLIADLLKDTLTAGDILIVNASGDLALLAKGSDTQVLTLSSGVPVWSSPASVPSDLSDLDDVATSTPTNRHALLGNGSAFTSRALVEADISDLGSYLTSPVDETDGGTGQTTLTAGDILYASASNTFSKLAKGTDGEVLTLASGVPSWAAAAGGLSEIGLFRGSTNVNITTVEATMDLTTESIDVDSNYSLSADVITVTRAGYYLISYSLTVSCDGGGGATHGYTTARVTKNGTTTEIIGSQATSYLNEGGSGNRPDTSVNATFITQLAASDTIRIRASHSQSTDVSQDGDETYLSIVKLADV
jgi:hypothetical protein